MAPEPGTVPDIDAAIDAARAELVAAFKRNDIASLAALFADDATLLPPGTRMITGREGTESFWRNVAERVGELSLTPTSVKPLGADSAREVGRMRMQASGQPAQEVLSKYLLLWQKSADRWTIESLIWNRVGTPQQGRPRQGAVGGGQRAAGGQAGRGRSPGGRSGYGRVSSLYSR